jgi:hypothetical protein
MSGALTGVITLAARLKSSSSGGKIWRKFIVGSNGGDSAKEA